MTSPCRWSSRSPIPSHSFVLYHTTTFWPAQGLKLARRLWLEQYVQHSMALWEKPGCPLLPQQHISSTRSSTCNPCWSCCQGQQSWNLQENWQGATITLKAEDNISFEMRRMHLVSRVAYIPCSVLHQSQTFPLLGVTFFPVEKWIMMHLVWDFWL